MRSSKRSALVLVCAPLLFFFCFRAADQVSGLVLDEMERPVPQALVRWQGDPHALWTDFLGRFEIPYREGKRLTASKLGWGIGFTSSTNLTIKLPSLPAEDNPDYHWIDPLADPRKPNNCGNCHGDIVSEWRESAHARGATNPKFLALFAGGDTSPTREQGRQPRREWNLLAEHPLGSGVCAACHAPTLQSPDLSYDVRAAKDVAARGVHCDYCHKIQDAPTDKLGTRFGRDGYRLLRPSDERQLFFGPLDDAVRPGETFVHSPLYKESRYCASCHEGVIFGVHVYGTYSEWLESPARSQGKECQHCHMTPTGKLNNIAPGKGGIQRDPKSLASHHFPGSALDMLRRSLKLEAATERDDAELRVKVQLRAENVGHFVPTGFIDRHLVLVVEAHDETGNELLPTNGPVLPIFAGKHVAGKAGWLFAKRLVADDGRTPLPFWLPHERVVDTRLVPGNTVSQVFAFPPSAKEARVRLLYRRFWPQVAEPLGWNDNELTVYDVHRR
ncbi:MAG: cytochrome c family protein [Gemmataceae bacterium]|nr:cytochrome c family protein [Gemmataceae bacterium]MCI0738570.1 cytochrome c family protein [Gemmataceae bacterium]